jgi:hypothetical protein
MMIFAEALAFGLGHSDWPEKGRINLVQNSRRQELK